MHGQCDAPDSPPGWSPVGCHHGNEPRVHYQSNPAAVNNLLDTSEGSSDSSPMDPRAVLTGSVASETTPDRSPLITCGDTSPSSSSLPGTSSSEPAQTALSRVTNIPLSIFDGATGGISKVPYDTTLAEVAEWVLTGRDPRSRVWRQPDLVVATIETTRLADEPGALEPGTPANHDYVKYKKSLPALMGQGCCGAGKQIVDVVQPSGLFPFDIDKLAAADVEREFERLAGFAEIQLMFRSPSQRGIKGFVLINPPPAPGRLGNDQSHAIFHQVMAYLEILGSVSTDESGKNLNRLCFLCHDPKRLWKPEGRTFLQVDPDSAPVPARPRKPRSPNPAGAALQEQAEDRDPARWDQVMTTRRANGVPPDPPDAFIQAALQYLADVRAGQDDNCCVGTGFSLKANDRPMSEWVEWLDRAGCGCSLKDREKRWHSLNPSINEQNYGAIVEWARRKGWDDTVPGTEGSKKTSEEKKTSEGKKTSRRKDRPSNWVEYRDSHALRAALTTLGYEIRYNNRAKTFELRESGGPWETTTESGDAYLRQRIADTYCYGQRKSPLRYHISDWKESVLAIIHHIQVDPLILALEAVPPWDGLARLDHYLTVVFDADVANPLVRWVARYLFVGVIQRAYQPGCRLKEMPVILSIQGRGKSPLLEVLLPQDDPTWFSDSAKFSSSIQEWCEALQGTAIAEIGECVGLQRNQEETKRRISTPRDKQRLAYRRDPEIMPRTCILVGTSDNLTGVLPNDPSGLTRFVPIVLPTSNMAIEGYMEENRNQLWAEAMHRYWKEGLRANLPRDLANKSAAAAAEHRSSNETMQEAIAKLSKDSALTLAHIVEKIQIADAGKGAAVPKAIQGEVTTELKNVGWTRQQTTIAKARGIYWFPPAK